MILEAAAQLAHYYASTVSPTQAAQGASSSPMTGSLNLPDITQILQFGLLGLIFVCVVLKKFLVPEWTLKQAEDRAAQEKAELTDRLNQTRDQLSKLQDVFQDQMIPALTRATEINARYTDEMQAARYRTGKPSQE